MEKIGISEKIVGWAIIAFLFLILMQICLVAAVHAQTEEPATNPYDTNMTAYQAIGKISFDQSFMEGVLLSCSGILTAIFTYRWLRRIVNVASNDD